MSDTIRISEKHMTMLDEMADMVGLDSGEDVASWMIGFTIETLHGKISSKVDDELGRIRNELINGTGKGGEPKGFLNER